MSFLSRDFRNKDSAIIEIEIVKKIVRDEMENAVIMDVNLDVDLNVGKSWYETK